MKIHEILECAHPVITIIVPNTIEKKLLIDRFRCNNAKVFNNVINYNNKVIHVFTIDELNRNWGCINNSYCFIEFPDAMPEIFVNKLQMSVSDFNFTNEIM